VDHPAPAGSALPRRPRPAGRTRVRRPHRRLGAALLVGVALAGSAGCGAATETPAAAATVPVPTPALPPPPPVVWPLTGVESGTVPARPALAVKIENSIDARPQTGLGAADLVWEEVVEGGITRYVAVYHSTLPAEIGPVRSIRPMDPAIAAPLHGLMAFSGGAKGYVQALTDAGLQLVSADAGAGGFHRISARTAPHNVYADPAALLAQADAGHAAAPAAQFDIAATAEQATAVTAGAPAAAVQLTLSGLSHPRWTWSSPDGRWVRAEGSTPAVEPDGAALDATNVVVLRVDVVDTARKDAAGNPVPETVMVGSGQALVATGGRTVAATWAKTAVTERLTLTGPDGAPLRLAPGATWVELVPNGTGAVTTD
jgi:glucose/arabinose dehydrogenase